MNVRKFKLRIILVLILMLFAVLTLFSIKLGTPEKVEAMETKTLNFTFTRSSHACSTSQFITPSATLTVNPSKKTYKCVVSWSGKFNNIKSSSGQIALINGFGFSSWQNNSVDFRSAGSVTFNGTFTAALKYNFDYPFYIILSGYHNYITCIDSFDYTTSTYYTINWSKAKPTLTLSNVSNGGVTNKNVTVSSPDSDVLITSMGTPIENGTTITSEGLHKIVITNKNDKLDLSSTYTFTIDRTPPMASIYSLSPSGATGFVNDGGVTPYAVYASEFCSDTKSVTLNGQPYTSGLIEESGDYTLVLTDNADNRRTYTFTIDKTPVIFNINTQLGSALLDGAHTNKSIYIQWSETTSVLTYTLNGAKYTYMQKYYQDKRNPKINAFTTLEACKLSIRNNEKNKIESIPAWDGEGTVYSQDIANALVGKQAYRYNNVIFITPTYLDAEIEKTVNLNCELVSKPLLTEEGTYIFTLTNYLGVSTTKTITIDKTAPGGTLLGVSNGEKTSSDVFFTWNEEGATATLNGREYISGTTIFAVPDMETFYSLILFDKAGNSTEFTFTISRIPPIGTLTGVTSGSETINKVVFTWDNNACTATLNDAEYISGTEIIHDGFYNIVLTDNILNLSSTYTFTIDKVAPEGTLSGVTNGGRTSSDVSFTWSEEGAIATLNGLQYHKNENIDLEKTHTLVLTDKAGNKTTYTFTIDKTAPEGILSGVTNGGSTNKSVRFTWSEEGATATLNNIPYTNNSAIAGIENIKTSYTIILSDSVGNENIYIFTINKILPDITFKSGGTSLNVKRNETFYFNANISFLYDTTDIIEVNINGVPTLETTIQSKKDTEITYNLEFTNSLGNKATYTIILDTIKYLTNYNELISSYKHHINRWWESYTYELSNNSYIQKNKFSFDNYDDALVFATRRENNIVESYPSYQGGNIFCNYANKYVDGIDVSNASQMINSPYYIYKDINSPNRLIAYFNISNLNRAVEKYALLSIKENYIPLTPAPAYPGDDFISSQEVFVDHIYLSQSNFTLPNKPTNITLTINGNIVSYDYVLTSGINYIIETDRAGNKTTYLLLLDTEAPIASASDFAGNNITTLSSSFNTQNEVYYNKSFRFFVGDLIDNNCLLLISFNGNDTIVFASDARNFYDFTMDGIYTLSWQDIAGNKKTVTLYLALTPPSLELVENKDVNDSTISFNFDVKKNLQYNRIDSIKVKCLLDGETVWNDLSVDGNNTLISKDTLSYIFFANGKYKIIVIDRFGIETTMEHTFIKNAPSGQFYYKDNSLVPPNRPVNKAVYLTWKEAGATCTINGAEYIKGSLLSAQGTYEFKLTDKGGNANYYRITIDLTPTKFTLENCQINGKTNKDISLSWDSVAEAGATAFIRPDNETTFKAFANGGSITKEGKYWLKIIDLASNEVEFFVLIDKTAPTITILTNNNLVVSPNSWINKDIRFSWGGEQGTAWVNGKTYLENSKITKEGSYSIIFEDNLGNRSYSSVKIDKTINEGTLLGVSTGGFTNSVVRFTWDDTDCTATLDDLPYSAGTDINVLKGTKKLFTIKLLDKAGNSLIYSFTISKIEPVGELNGVSNGGTTNKMVTFSWISTHFSATLNGVNYSSNSRITEEGFYELILLDNQTQNNSYYSFTIDKVAPEGTLLGVSNGGRTSSDVSFSWQEKDATATLNGSKYTKNHYITEEGKYELVLSDSVGNKTIYSFTIDKTAPEGTLSGVINGQTTNGSVTFSWVEYSATATLNGAEYVAGTRIVNDGKYELVLSDNVGNKTIYTFTIDKTKPFASFKNEFNELVASTAYYNHSIIISFDESVTAMLNDVKISANEVISNEGKYILLLRNRLGTSTEYTFTIDKTAPEGVLKGVENNSLSASDVSFTWNEFTATCTINGAEYISGTKITNEGKYEIILTDRAGNSSYYNFQIYKLMPSATSYGFNEFNLSNDYVYFEVSSFFTATLNGAEYISGTQITDEGSYSLIVTNIVGQSVSYDFAIDKTAPTLLFKTYLDYITSLSKYPFTIESPDKDIASILVNNEASSLGTTLKINGDYSIYVVDKAGNINIYFVQLNADAPEGFFDTAFYNNKTAYDTAFTFSSEYTATLNGAEYISGTVISCPENTKQEFFILLTNKFGTVSSYNFVLDKIPPDGTLTGVTNNGVTNKIVTFTFDYSYTATLNEDEYISGTQIIGLDGEEKTYTLLLQNQYGGSQTYIFTIDKIPPKGDLIGVEAGGITNKSVRFDWLDDTCVVLLDDKEYQKNTDILIGENTKKRFIILITDRAGNSSSYSFTINKLVPILSSRIPPDRILTEDFKITFDSTLYTATLNGAVISTNYILQETGEYIILLTDALGNKSKFVVRLDKSNLSLILLKGDEEKIYSSEKITSSEVITLNSDLIIKVNGEEVPKGYVLDKEGVYEITLETELGLSKTYTISLEKPYVNPSEKIIAFAIPVALTIIATVIIFLICRKVKKNRKNKKTQLI